MILGHLINNNLIPGGLADIKKQFNKILVYGNKKSSKTWSNIYKNLNQ